MGVTTPVAVVVIGGGLVAEGRRASEDGNTDIDVGLQVLPDLVRTVLLEERRKKPPARPKTSPASASATAAKMAPP